MKILLLIHGPNLNLLGKRDPAHYSSCTLADVEKIVCEEALALGYDMRAFQSNHEGGLIDWIQENVADAAGIIINPGALTHYSYSLHDALLDARVPSIEVHLSAINTREDWRRVSVTAPACIRMIEGKREEGYRDAVRALHDHLQKL